jgi:hypothetical protein
MCLLRPVPNAYPNPSTFTGVRPRPPTQPSGQRINRGPRRVVLHVAVHVAGEPEWAVSSVNMNCVVSDHGWFLLTWLVAR